MDENLIASEFQTFLRAHRPDLKVLEVRPDAVVLDVAAHGRTTLMLHRLHNAIALLSENTPRNRAQEYEKFLALLLSDDASEVFEAASAPDAPGRVFPKLVSAGFVAEVRRQTGTSESEIPHREFDQSGLLLVYVLDFPDRVAYILQPQMDELGLELDALHERALENARELFDFQTAREIIEASRESVSVAMCEDGHNSARVIILSEYLRDEEELVALLPDKTALLLAPVPDSSEGWDALGELAANLAAQSPAPFLRFPLLVTPRGVEAR